jgi:hypothetical protein
VPASNPGPISLPQNVWQNACVKSLPLVKESPPFGTENATIDIETSKTQCFAHFLLFAQPLTCEKTYLFFTTGHSSVIAPIPAQPAQTQTNSCNVQKAIFCKVVPNCKNM